MKKIFIIVAICTLMTSCVAGPNPLRDKPGPNGKVAGFFNGVWDGAISPITFVISLFNENVEIYNPNRDGWYPFGFMIGIGTLGGSSASVSRKD